MRHARQLQAQRRGGDIAGPAWPSIVATTTSLSGAAAGIASLLIWDDTFHLRLGVGMATAGAVFSSVAVLIARRDRTTRRELVSGMREDLASELRYETGRRDQRISQLKTDVLAAEEIVVLYEHRVAAEQARADASEAARVRAEHDLAVLSAWVQQTTAAAELTRSAVQSVARVQPFEPGHTFEPVAVHDARYNGYNTASASSSYQGAYEALNGRDPYTGYDGYGAVEVYQEPAVYAEEVPVYGSVQEFEADYGVAGVGKVGSAGHHAGAEIDLRPAAAVPVQPSPILAAAREQPAVEGARPLRPAVLSGREEVGFNVAGAIAGPGAEPYTVPGVVMPRQRGDGAPALPPARPVSPERLYRPYLANGAAGGAPIDLTMHDETQQLSKVEHRQTGTA
ncbi:MAG: hypothetical protein AUG49_14035 [Catenulispora sp. 13_1_20CM_3_70_7]|nr:hypothetical protein [Catenulisporales bacterium]OLE24189.1 MAG: hypothetical protein AUG49_14035 [Catenulispora sp. 13_1_20CM_3_70_7]